jgi:arylsulfatase A-like enzyme
LTSDHGEAFGEHGLYRHGFELWEELVRVPWIFYVPGVDARRHKVRRSAIDLVPTILDLFGLPIPRGAGDDFVSGQSLLADIFMPKGHEATERIVFCDMSAGPHNAERQAFIEGGKKLVAADGRPLSLYDLDQDPAEKKDLLDDKAISAPLVERFKAFRRNLSRDGAAAVKGCATNPGNPPVCTNSPRFGFGSSARRGGISRSR